MADSSDRQYEAEHGRLVNYLLEQLLEAGVGPEAALERAARMATALQGQGTVLIDTIDHVSVASGSGPEQLGLDRDDDDEWITL